MPWREGLNRWALQCGAVAAVSWKCTVMSPGMQALSCPFSATDNTGVFCDLLALLLPRGLVCPADLGQQH